jgi:hypothetical protein
LSYSKSGNEKEKGGGVQGGQEKRRKRRRYRRCEERKKKKKGGRREGKREDEEDDKEDKKAKAKTRKDRKKVETKRAEWRRRRQTNVRETRRNIKGIITPSSSLLQVLLIQSPNPGHCMLKGAETDKEKSNSQNTRTGESQTIRSVNINRTAAWPCIKSQACVTLHAKNKKSGCNSREKKKNRKETPKKTSPTPPSREGMGNPAKGMC